MIATLTFATATYLSYVFYLFALTELFVEHIDDGLCYRERDTDPHVQHTFSFRQLDNPRLSFFLTCIHRRGLFLPVQCYKIDTQPLSIRPLNHITLGLGIRGSKRIGRDGMESAGTGNMT